MRYLSDLLVESYRPQKLKDLILPDEFRQLFESYIKNKDISNLLFVGPPGTGKTSTAKVLKNEILNSDYDFLLINASLERGIDLMRTKISNFMSSPPLTSPIKIVLLDEADNLTEDAFKSLRALMESDLAKFHNIRFILTANYENKLIEAILSRLTKFVFDYIPKDQLIRHLETILNDLQISYEESEIYDLINAYYPDVRGILNYIAKYSHSSTFSFSNEKDFNLKSEMISLLYESVKHVQDTNDPSYEKFKEYLSYANEHPMLIEITISEVMKYDDIKPFAFIILNRYLNTMKAAVSKLLHLQAMYYEIFYAGVKYIKMFSN